MNRVSQRQLLALVVLAVGAAILVWLGGMQPTLTMGIVVFALVAGILVVGSGGDNSTELVEAMPTVDGVTILYRNHRGQLVAETVLWGADGLVHTAVVAYGAPPSA